MAWINRPRWVASAAAAALIVGTGSAPAANLFDAISSIFGGNAPAASQPQAPVQEFRYEDAGPVNRSFRARRPHPQREHVQRERVQREKVQRAERDRKPVNTAMDPAKVPDWYLQDPTLRRGDIVVLASGVFVFEGNRAPHSSEDFVPLERSRLSADERAKLAEMTGYRPERVASAARAKTASADTVETTGSIPRAR